MTDPTVARGAARAVGGMVVQAALLLILAGTWRWPAAWVYLAGHLAVSAWLVRHVARRDPALLERNARLRLPPGGRGVLQGALVVLLVALFAATALDVRFDGARVPAGWRAVGFLLLAAAAALVAATLREDARATDLVQVGPDDGPRLVTTGPYRWVRHPLHLALLAWAFALPLALGSGWALVVSGALALADAGVVGALDRRLREDDLRFQAYAALTPWRLVPLVW